MTALRRLWARLTAIDPARTSTPATTISPYPDGPLIVRGDFAMRTPDGRHIDAGRGTVALCRCGRSATKPFCDGTHKIVGFRAPSETPDRPLARP